MILFQSSDDIETVKARPVSELSNRHVGGNHTCCQMVLGNLDKQKVGKRKREYGKMEMREG